MDATFAWLEIAGLSLAGVLAGEEFIVRYGVHPALAALTAKAGPTAGIQARQALVRRLRIVVPAVIVPTFLLGVAVMIVGGSGHGMVFRWAGTLALVAFVLLSFLGTVPINIQVNDWDADAPPANWAALVGRWEFIDVFRSSAALVAFACYLAAVVL